MLDSAKYATNFWISIKNTILDKGTFFLGVLSAGVVLYLLVLCIIQSFCILIPGILEVIDQYFGQLGKILVNDELRKKLSSDDDTSKLALLSKHVLIKITLLVLIMFIARHFIWGRFL